MDFGFVGPSYTAPSIYQDANECINFFPEIDPLKQPGERGVVALYPTPGLIAKVLLQPGEVRGLRTLAGGQYLVAVCGPYVYLIDSSFNSSIIGFLNTSVGIVGITDNGVNVYIVDGAYRYTWRISTPSTAVFRGSISGTTLTVTSVSSGTIGVGQQVFGVGVSNETVITALGSGSGGVGTYTVNISQTVAAENLSSSAVAAVMTASISGTTLTVTAVTGTLYVGQTVQGAGVAANTMITALGTGTGGTGNYTVSTSQTVASETMYALNFTQIPSSDGAFSGGSSVDTVDNYFVYNRPDTQQWASSDLLSPITPALSYAVCDAAPDNLVSLIVDHREVYLLGEASSEVWVDVGAVPFPFQRIPGTSTQHGIAAEHSLARVGNSFAYVSRNNRGQGQIMQMNGYIPQRISTHAVENSLANQYISDAIAWTYQLEGHECYVVTFPTLDLTWVYDVATQMWHKWLSVDNFNQYHRHRGNCCAVFQGLVLVGDYANGKIYELDKNTYTDDGAEIRRLRRAPHLVSDLQRQFFEEFQIQFQPGVGTTGLSIQTGVAPIQVQDPFIIYANDTYVIKPNDQVFIGQLSTINPTDVTTYPQAMLRWSNDGGSTYSNEHWVTIGQAGKYQNRAIWRRLGWSRDRIFEVVVTDPVKAVIVSANLKASAGDN